MCDECRASMPADTWDAIEAFTEQWPDAEFGPAHIVLSDFNLEDGHIAWCLALIDAALNGTTRGLSRSDIAMLDRLNWYRNCDREELLATQQFLSRLASMPRSL